MEELIFDLRSELASIREGGIPDVYINKCINWFKKFKVGDTAEFAVGYDLNYKPILVNFNITNICDDKLYGTRV